MKDDLLFYVVAACVVIITFGGAFLLPVGDSYRGLITLPGLVALFGIVIEAWRDKRNHERALELLAVQQDHSLAIASHMAKAVFDRQVAFCEEYFEKANSILEGLFRDGPTAAALEKAQELHRIRTRYSPWLSPKMEAGLLPFEGALREVGVDAQLIGTHLPQPEHSFFVRRMYDAFIKLIDNKEGFNEDAPEEAISSIISHLRNVFGVTELTQLRDQAIQLAMFRAASS